MEDTKKTLSELEMVKMEQFQNLKKIEDLRLIIKDKDLASFNIQTENLKLRIELIKKYVENTNRAKKEIESLVKTISTDSREYNNDLAEKYNLNEKWGYNPDTGELIENNE